MTLPKPSPKTYSIGDNVIITGPRNSKWIGSEAIILDFNYLPASYRKGYKDYTATLEIVTPPMQGHQLRVQSGYFAQPTHITTEEIQKRIQLGLEAKHRKHAVSKIVHQILKEHGDELRKLRATDVHACYKRMDELTANEEDIMTKYDVHKSLWKRLR